MSKISIMTEEQYYHTLFYSDKVITFAKRISIMTDKRKVSQKSILEKFTKIYGVRPTVAKRFFPNLSPLIMAGLHSYLMANRELLSPAELTKIEQMDYMTIWTRASRVIFETGTKKSYVYNNYFFEDGNINPPTFYSNLLPDYNEDNATMLAAINRELNRDPKGAKK